MKHAPQLGRPAAGVQATPVGALVAQTAQDVADTEARQQQRLAGEGGQSPGCPGAQRPTALAARHERQTDRRHRQHHDQRRVGQRRQRLGGSGGDQVAIATAAEQRPGTQAHADDEQARAQRVVAQVTDRGDHQGRADQPGEQGQLPAHHTAEPYADRAGHDECPQQVEMAHEQHDAGRAARQPEVGLDERHAEQSGRLQKVHLVDEGPGAERKAVRHGHVEALVAQVGTQKEASPGKGEGDDRNRHGSRGKEGRRREAPPPPFPDRLVGLSRD